MQLSFESRHHTVTQVPSLITAPIELCRPPSARSPGAKSLFFVIAGFVLLVHNNVVHVEVCIFIEFFGLLAIGDSAGTSFLLSIALAWYFLPAYITSTGAAGAGAAKTGAGFADADADAMGDILPLESGTGAVTTRATSDLLPLINVTILPPEPPPLIPLTVIPPSLGGKHRL